MRVTLSSCALLAAVLLAGSGCMLPAQDRDQELFLPPPSNCMHKASNLGSSHLPSDREDLGSGPALVCNVVMVSHSGWSHRRSQGT